jgi:glycosyltransferase involved in cell wall biosynthesis
MNLLLYTHYWAPSVGGVETISMSLAEGLATRQPAPGEDVIHVTLVTQTPAGAMDDSLFPFRVVRRPSIRKMIQLVLSADLIHVEGPALLPLLLGFLLRRPTLVEHPVYQAICPNGLLIHEPERSICPGHFMAGNYGECVRCESHNLGLARSFRSLILAFPRLWLSRRVAGNIAITNHVARRIALPRTQTIYYGVPDTGALACNTPIGNGNPVRIAYVGRLVPEKGLPLLLEAAKLLKEASIPFHLTFIGNGTQRQQLEGMTDTFALREYVTFTGDLRGASFAEALRKVHLVVMPSMWEETAGLAAIEHMMRGGVVVVADVGGLSEVVGDAGLKFTMGDSQALADCIQRAYDNPSLTAFLSASARKRATQVFNQGRMIQDDVRLYQEISARRAKVKMPEL